MSVGSTFHFISTCFDDKDPVAEVIKRKVPYIFPIDDQIPVYALSIDFISITATFIWNFLDVFIMVVSLGLSTHFKLLNIELREANEVNL